MTYFRRSRRMAMGKLTLLLVALLVTACGAVQPTLTPAPTALPTTPPPPAAGQAIKGSSASVYRLMGNNTLRHITSWATFLGWGYTPGDIREIPETTLRLYPLESPLSRFVTGTSDTGLYALFNGSRYPISDAPFLHLIDSFPTQVSQISDDVLHSLPLGTDTYPAPAQFSNDPMPVSAAAWDQDALWIAAEDGTLRRFAPQTGIFTTQTWGGGGYVAALRVLSGVLYAGTSTGLIIPFDNPQNSPLGDKSGWIGALGTQSSRLIAADRGHYDRAAHAYQTGRGLIDSTGAAIFPPEEPLRWITALEGDSVQVWAGTAYTGLLHCEIGTTRCDILNTFNSAIPDNTIRDLTLAPDGAVWFAHPGGVTRYDGLNFLTFNMGGGVSAAGVMTVAFVQGEVWAAGDSFIAHIDTQGQVTTYSAFDHPLLLDRFTHIEVDDQGVLWVVGQQRLIRMDGQTWKAYPYEGSVSLCR